MYNKNTMSHNKRTFSGIQITRSYTSPFRDEGIPLVSRRKTPFLKDEFVSWFIRYAQNRVCTLHPAEFSFLSGEAQEAKQQAELRQEKETKKRRNTIILSAVVPIGLLLLSSVLYGVSRSSFSSFLFSLRIMAMLFPVPLMVLMPLAITNAIKGSRERYKADEPAAIANALQAGQYTAYQFEIVQKKWSEDHHTHDDHRGGYYTYDFYVEFDEITMEVDAAEYNQMGVGGVAVVVMIHTPQGETMRVIAPRR